MPQTYLSNQKLEKTPDTVYTGVTHGTVSTPHKNHLQLCLHKRKLQEARQRFHPASRASSRSAGGAKGACLFAILPQGREVSGYCVG
jgi:hypothetical protein